MTSQPGPFTMAQFEQLQKDNEMLRERLRLVQERHGGTTPPDLVAEPAFVHQPIDDGCALYSSDSSGYATSNRDSRNKVGNEVNELFSTGSPISIPRRSSGTYVIRVESGLLGSLPPSMWISDRRSPCAVFAVTDIRSGEIVWRFVKDYEQLRNFHDLLLSTLAPLIRTSKVHLSSFPYRTQKENLFSTTSIQPWCVDVRNDMLNAYFITVSQLSRNKYVQRNSSIRNEVERAVAALWQSNLVDIPRQSLPHEKRADEMFGFLLSRRSGERSWKPRFYVINGAFLDIQDQVGAGKVNASIPLSGAHIQLKITFYDTSEADERYAFTVFERSDLSHAHTFTAENEATRAKWISKLRSRVAEIATGSIRADARFYSADRLPVPYEPRECNIQLLDAGPEHVSISKPTSFASADKGKRIDTKPTQSASTTIDPSHSRVYLREGSKDKIKAELAKLAVYESLYPGGSEDRMDFFSGLDSATETESLSENSSASGPLGKLNLKTARVRNRHLRRHTEDFVQSPLTPITGASMLVVGQNNFAERRKSSHGGHARDPTLNRAGIFGVMPEDCKYLRYSTSGELVPTVVSRCVERLSEPEAIKEIGIFRTSGTQTQIDVLQDEFDSNGDFDILKAKVDAHSSADLLKRYLRMLPRSLFGEWGELKSKSVLSLDKADQVKVLIIEMEGVKKVNRAVISSVLAVLQKARDQEQQNAMSLRNLGVALSPALKVPSPVLELFINHFQEVFETSSSGKRYL